MYGLDVYKKLLGFVENNDVMIDEMRSIVQNDYCIDMNDDYENAQIIFEHDGKQFNLADNWDDVIQRFDEDKPQFWFWQFDPNDEYALFVSGYYDSWGGSEIETEYMIGKVSEIVVRYKDFIKI